jgi:hypothetical protein
VPPPHLNRLAFTAYRCAIYGLIPVAGLVLGALALVLGVIAWIRCRNYPAKNGKGHAVTGIVLGCLELLSNSVGLTFIWIGVTSLYG